MASTLATANAQMLWDKARIGMSPADILNLYPNAAKSPDKGRRTDGQKDLLHIPYLVMGKLPSTVHFFFDSDRLRSVAWRISPTGDFDATIPDYELFLDSYKAFSPAAKNKKSTRQLQYSRLLADSWTTKEGVDISFYLFDAAPSLPVRFFVVTEANINNWILMKLGEDIAKNKKEHAERVEVLNNQKKTQEQSYNKFLDGLIGADIGELAGKWGAPTGETNLPNSDIIYVWDLKSGEWQCRTSIFTNTKGKIKKWQWSGNNCK